MTTRSPKLLLASILLLALVLAGAAPAGATRVQRATRQAHHQALVRRFATHVVPQRSASAAGGRASQVTGSCANADLAPIETNLDLVRAATLCLINRVRAAHRLPALGRNSTLQAMAEAFSQKMVTENFFAHVTPSGQTPLTRFRLSGYIPGNVTFSVGENIAWGTGTFASAAMVVDKWVHSPEHLANILNPRFRETGIGAVADVPGSVATGPPGATYDEEFGYVVP